MSKLRISPVLALPLEAITETIAILGIRGSGKTNTAVVYAEELLHAGQQVVILDPTDAWWGLKSSKDGERPGYPVVVLGGKQQNLPLGSGDGKLVADFVVEQGASVICSMRGFESKGQELAFTTAFLRRLYYLKGQQQTPTPLALIIDEASRLVPQRVMGEEAACVGAVQQIVRQGRSSGFGVVLIDQRAATVNKDVLAQLEMLVVHRTTGPQDRKALREWVQQHDTESRESAFLDSLASLDQGEAWFWSPGWLDLFKRVPVRERRTFDSSRTPRAGEVAVTPKKIADVDIDALREKMAATLEKAKADDPKELRKRIAELERAVKTHPKAGTPVADQRAIERTVAVAVKPYQKQLETTRLRIEQAIRGLHGQLGILEPLAVSLGEDVASAVLAGRSDIASVLKSAAVSAPAPNVPAREKPSSQGSVGKTPQRILNALRFLESVGTSPASRAAVSGLVGVSYDTGTFRNYLSELRSAGFVADGPGTDLSLTEAGRAQASDEGLPRTCAELHAAWLSKLGGTPQRMLNVLLGNYPDTVTRAQLASACGVDHNTGTFRNYLSELRSPGLMTDVDKQTVRAADALFPAGLR